MRLMSPFIFMDKRNFFEWTNYYAAASIHSRRFYSRCICCCNCNNAIQLYVQSAMYPFIHMCRGRSTPTSNQSYFIPKWVAANVKYSLFYNKRFSLQKAYEVFCIRQQKHTKHSCSFFRSVAYAYDTMFLTQGNTY